MFLSFCVLDDFFRFSKKNLFFGYSWCTLLWYRCYYPHWSRDALSPVCGIFYQIFCILESCGPFFILSVIMTCVIYCILSPFLAIGFKVFYMPWDHIIYSRASHWPTLTKQIFINKSLPTLSGSVPRPLIDHTPLPSPASWPIKTNKYIYIFFKRTADIFVIGATIWIGKEIKCLPYAGCLSCLALQSFTSPSALLSSKSPPALLSFCSPSALMFSSSPSALSLSQSPPAQLSSQSPPQFYRTIHSLISLPEYRLRLV